MADFYVLVIHKYAPSCHNGDGHLTAMGSFQSQHNRLSTAAEVLPRFWRSTSITVPHKIAHKFIVINFKKM